VKLLIITQGVDAKDPVLGFFHRWIQGLAKKSERVEVICLFEGEHNLPANVRVHSLGKESGRKSRLAYACRFLSLVWKLRREYDTVFVHMNQEYILLAGWLWMLWSKPVFFWRNHKMGNWLTNIATGFTKKLFCTSPYAYIAKNKKTELMPAGVDTELFALMSSAQRTPRSILSLGRIAPVKRLEVLLEAAKLLQDQNIPYSLQIYGDALPIDAMYEESLKKFAETRALNNVSFKPGVRNDAAPEVYGSHEVFVNLTNTGSFDKTLFEAMACGTLTATSNEALKEIIPAELFFEEYDAASLAHVLATVLELPETQKISYREKLRSYVVEQHSLSLLIERLSKAFSAA
jgi:glycosyltransferase involved in cell wall biosynthesis